MLSSANGMHETGIE